MPVVHARQLVETNPAIPIQHVGLALSKLAPLEANLGGEKGAFSSFVRDRLARATPHPSYADAFRRWQRRTAPGPLWRRVLRLKAEVPVLVGMGEPTPSENGLSLHPCWGTPILPGSALKGVCAAWCAETHASGPWAVGGEDYHSLFGRMPERGGEGAEAGAVDFLDALAEPEGLEWTAEVLTPHHADYYQGKGPPTGWDGPIPVTFLGARGTFRLVLEGPPAWLDRAAALLVEALSARGVGSKTRAGYGRLIEVAGLDRVDREALDTAAKRDFPSWEPSAQLRHLQESGSEAGLAQSLELWLLQKPPQLAQVAELRRDEATWRAVAGWFESRGAVADWRKRARGKHGERAAELLAAVRPWLPEEPLGEEPGKASTTIDDRSGESEPGPSSTFGPNRLSELPELPGNDKKRAKVINDLATRVASGRFDEESVRRALAFLVDAEAKGGTINMVRRAYGLVEE